MKARAPVMAPASRVAQGGRAMEIWIKRGGPGKSGAGASGWKMRPSAVLARSLAERKRGK